MSRRRVLAISRRLLEQFRHDRRTLALLFVAPLVIMSLLYFLLRGSGAKPEIGIVNEDPGSTVAAAISGQLQSSSNVTATTLDVSRAQARLKDGSLAGYVVFPGDFTVRIQRDGVVAPEVRLEGSEPQSSQAVRAAVAAAVVGAAAQFPLSGGGAIPRFAPQVTYLYGGPEFDTLDYFGAAFIGLAVFFLVFVITIVAFLRERSQGTLERLMASPLRRGEIVVGYMLGFTAVALVQAAEVLLFALYVLHVRNHGSVLLIFGIETLLVLVAVNLGIFLSMFAQTEFQAVQFIPLVVVPQLLMSGIVFPLTAEPSWLQALSNVLPLTYAVSAMRDVMVKGGDLTWGAVQLDVAVVAVYAVVLVGAATATLRRRIA